MSYDDIKRGIIKCIGLIDKKSYINYFNAYLRKTKKKNDKMKSRFHRKSKIYKKYFKNKISRNRHQMMQGAKARIS